MQWGDSSANEAGRRSAGRPASCGLRPLVSRAFGSGGVGCGGWGFVLLSCVGTLPPSCRTPWGRPCPIPTDGVRNACFSFTSSLFFLMSTLILLRRTAHLPGGTVFSRRERTIAHRYARTACVGGASCHSRGRICPAPRRGFATLCPLAPPMVGGLGGATAAPDAGARS